MANLSAKVLTIGFVEALAKSKAWIAQNIYDQNSFVKIFLEKIRLVVYLTENASDLIFFIKIYVIKI
ncbi:hypothetical protein KBB68_03885 [Candidatus Babeliales bacterium]|nr:hypothetical protein [Candidatus Babeliales bacterium]